jgi:uncharacterized DUF497 family protein
METEFEEFAGFQWDEGNINKNLVEHQVEDWESEQVFFNEPVLVLDDPKHSLVEKRWAAFGRTDAGRLLVVIFTKRGNLLRVISARDMNRKKMKYYEENA